MIRSATKFVHQNIKDILSKNSICVDATCGNGNDTLFLAKTAKKVYAFDIQEQAIVNTKTLINSYNLGNVELIKDSHSNMLNYILDPVDIITFNLGYLPGGDDSVTTNSSSLEAIDIATKIVASKGLITIIVYIGHDKGKIESEAIFNYVKSLPKTEFNVTKYEFVNKNDSPYVLLIEKV